MGNSRLIADSLGAFDLYQTVVIVPWKQIQKTSLQIKINFNENINNNDDNET